MEISTREPRTTPVPASALSLHDAALAMTGLGLSLSRQLVELMGGRLELHSALGQGSEFYFTLGDLPAGKDSSS